MPSWSYRFRQFLRRHPIWLLLLLFVGAAILVVDDVTWKLRSSAMVVWSRYHEKFAPSPALTDLSESDKVILFWTPFFGGMEYNVGYGRAPFRNCPVSQCVTTNQRRHLRRADVVVFHPVEFSDMDLPDWRSPDQLWMFFMLESPPNTGGKFTKSTQSLFNLTVTYRWDSDIRQPYFVVEPIPERERNEYGANFPWPTVGADGYKQALPWVVSNCKTPGKRERFVKELMQHIPVDIFGRCGPLRCSPLGGLLAPPAPGLCYRRLPQRYQFYLSLENSRCRDYITEKFFFALNSSLVPIVYGARRRDYERVAPPHSFIHVDDFRSPRQLADYVQQLMSDPRQLEPYTRWRGKYRIRFSDSDSWCELCRRLHEGDVRPSNYEDINQWWRGPDQSGDVCWS